MYIFKSNSSDGVDEKLSKPSSSVLSSVADASSTRILLSPVVTPQNAVLAGSSASSGPVLTRIVDSIITAGVVSNIAVPLTSEYSPQAANEDLVKSLAGALEAFTKNVLNQAGEANFAPVPITSLSDSGAVKSLSIASHQGAIQLPVTNISPSILPAPLVAAETYSVPTVSAVVPITALTDSDVAVTATAKRDVLIKDVIQQAVVQGYVNAEPEVLAVATTGTYLSSLTLTSNVAFTASAVGGSSGITVSSLSDSSDVALYLVGGTSAKQGVVDVITLGDGNNFVLDAGDGQVLLNYGSGANVVMLIGEGVSGNISFASVSHAVGNFVTIASNAVDGAQTLGSSQLVTISGLNNHHASDAQAVSVSGDNTSGLFNSIDAAQPLSSNTHNVAWFQFDGHTYVFESALGNSGNHVGDTLVRLTGLTQFTGNDGELSFGALHLAG
jgi:hypothetical protein